MAYVLGFFAADGNLSINKRGGCYISFQSKDKQIISAIKKTMNSRNKVSVRINNLTQNKFYRLQIGSKEIVEILMDIGYRTSKTKHLPFPNMPPKFLCHFVRGYFDGDGNIWKGEVHKNRKTKLKVLQLSFTSGAYDFLRDLKILLNKKLNTKGSHVVLKGGAYSRLQFSTKDALKIYNFMYNDNCPLFLERKKRQFDKNIKYLRP